MVAIFMVYFLCSCMKVWQRKYVRANWKQTKTAATEVSSSLVCCLNAGINSTSPWIESVQIETMWVRHKRKIWPFVESVIKWLLDIAIHVVSVVQSNIVIRRLVGSMKKSSYNDSRLIKFPQKLLLGSRAIIEDCSINMINNKSVF